MEGNSQVYKCKVKGPLPKKLYLGLAEGEWKSHFYNHNLSFKHKRYFIKTTLLSYTWRLKSVSSETPSLKWSVLCFDMRTTILKYLEEIPFVLIGKTGNSYLSKPEGTLKQEI